MSTPPSKTAPKTTVFETILWRAADTLRGHMHVAKEHGHVLTPRRRGGSADVEEDGEPSAEKMARLTKTLEAQCAESARPETAIRENPRGMGYGN